MIDSSEQNTKKTIRTFGWASFFNDIGSHMVFPVWPLFLSTVLNANMTVIGFIDGLGNALVSVSQALSGYYSDRLKRRKIFIWTGYVLGAIARIGYALSVSWQMVIPFRVLDRTGKIRSAPRDAIIADISEKKRRGGNFGFLRAMDNLGAFVGVLICILLFDLLGYRMLFFLAAIPGIIGAGLIIINIKERKAPGIKIYKGLSLKDLDRNFILFLVLSGIFALGAFTYSFLLLLAKEVGFQITFIPVLFLIYTASVSLFSIPFGRLADVIGRKWVIALAFLFWGLVCLMVILFSNLTGIIICFILFGLHRAALDPVQKAFVSDLAPPEFRASSLGGYQMVIGLCALPASLMAGLLWDKISIETPFYVSLGLTAISMGLLLFVREKS